ncbi:uncharacterized protein [Coffea arabica]|uniref:Uncharacterized protein isoform X1 n=1 Tax=Coffea arabica TaxID=13443 RepID=A0A6P6XIG6_COFAR|nr:WAS/WASL-interacting protein family member 1-like isoform X1 [Coffea arabica]
MAQEDHGQKYSNSSSGGGASGSGGNIGGGSTSGRSQKKMKQKKVPQRGLGVAQLEKIRLEEQQKIGVVLQAADVLPPNQIISPSNSSPCLAAQCPAFRPSFSSCHSVPLPPPSPSDLPSPNSLFRPTPSIPSVDIMHTNSVPLSKPFNVEGGGEIGWSAVPALPKVWNGEFSTDGESQSLDHLGFAYRSNANLPFGSSNPTPFLSLPNVLQRSQQFLPPSSSSMVNISSAISSPPILNFQMEPPSNQNFCASNYTPLWPDEEKMIGMKRPYPFPMETPPAPAFHFKYPPCYVAPIPRLDEPASCSNRCTATTEPEFPVTSFREGPSRSSTQAEATHKEVNIRQNGGLDGDFLTLAPPAAAARNLNSQYRHFLSNSGPQSLSEFGSQPSQGSSDDTVQGQGSSKSMRPPFFSFFPAAKKQVGQVATPADNCNGDVGENVDLSLRL